MASTWIVEVRRHGFAGWAVALALAGWLVSSVAWGQERGAAARSAERRVALVVGNAAYQQGRLANPVNDARAMREKLRGLGFEVVYREDLKIAQVGGMLREFRTQLKGASVALIFYAGHGLQVQGSNYLPTVDADIQSEDDVAMQGLDVARLMSILEESSAKVGLVILDACRNNPYKRSARSTDQGLARVNAASGVLIAFATRPGGVAADGDRKNGLFTEKLLEQIDEIGLPVEQVFKRVAVAVKRASGGRQEPWVEGLIEGDFYFRPGVTTVAIAAPPPAAPPRTDDIEQLRAELAALKKDFGRTEPGRGDTRAEPTEPRRHQAAAATPAATPTAAPAPLASPRPATDASRDVQLAAAPQAADSGLIERMAARLDDDTTLASALASVVPAGLGESSMERLSRIERFLRSLRWPSAAALAVDESGGLVLGYAISWINGDLAVKEAVSQCESRAGHARCHMVLHNAKLKREALAVLLADVQRTLGGTAASPARSQFIRSIDRLPIAEPVGLMNVSNCGAGGICKSSGAGGR